jgi:Holliday junction resolvase RusA-like endonuclease
VTNQGSLYFETFSPPSTNHLYTPIGRGKQILKANVSKFKNQTGYLAKGAARQQGWKLTSEPVKMTIWWTPPDRRKRDSSNIIKAIEDAIAGIVYQDDSQVMTITVHKMKPIKPGSTLIVVEELRRDHAN